MSSLDISQAANYIPTAFSVDLIQLNHIKFSFFIGIGVFLISIPFCKSRKSFFDAITARRLAKIFRTFVFLQLISLSILIYFYVTNGNPVYLHALLQYGNGDSWLYGYGRPSAGMIFISLGLLGALYPLPRLFCMLGCLGQIFGDCLSAYQIRDYYHQVRFNSAPANGYSQYGLMVYYWRDIVSIGLCTAIFLFGAYLSCIMGWCDPMLIHPSYITGKEQDRYAVLENMRQKRKYMERVGIVEASVIPLFHRKLSDFNEEERKNVHDEDEEDPKDPQHENHEEGHNAKILEHHEDEDVDQEDSDDGDEHYVF
jgi:hypothetical protein